MVHLYSAFNQSALHRLCIKLTHSHTHSYTDGIGNHAMDQPAHRELLGVQNLAQGSLNTNSNLSGTLHVQDSFSTPEPLPAMLAVLTHNRLSVDWLYLCVCVCVCVNLLNVIHLSPLGCQKPTVRVNGNKRPCSGTEGPSWSSSSGKKNGTGEHRK